MKKKIYKPDLPALITAALEMPKEVALDLPLISVAGSEELLIENYKTLLGYTAESVRVLAKGKVIAVLGRRLSIKGIGTDFIKITGNISNIIFE